MIKELCRDEVILSQRCEVATVEDESVAQDLIDTIKSLEDAGCLAANQIGVTKKVDAGEPHVLYNPRLVFGLGASKMEESCLTHDEITKSTRYIKCKVAFDQIVDGKMKECRRDYAGFEAQMIQHMIDHCLGKLV
jgi:peptide deformylase